MVSLVVASVTCNAHPHLSNTGELRKLPKTSLDILKQRHQELIRHALPHANHSEGLFILFHGRRARFLGIALAHAKNSDDYKTILQHQFERYQQIPNQHTALPDYLTDQTKLILNAQFKRSRLKGLKGYHALLTRLDREIDAFKIREAPAEPSQPAANSSPALK